MAQTINTRRKTRLLESRIKSSRHHKLAIRHKWVGRPRPIRRARKARYRTSQDRHNGSVNKRQVARSS